VQGGFGIGKTYLMSAMAKELNKKGAGVTMVELGEFIETYKNNFGNNEDKQEKVLNKLIFVDVLIIDDIGAEHTTEWSIEQIIYPILNKRYKSERLTFFTSNLTKVDYAKRLINPANKKKTDKDTKETASRLLTRLDALTKEIQTSGDNKRESYEV